MKQISIIMIALSLFTACNKEADLKEYVSLSGKILNANDSILSINGQQYNKIIQLEKDGSFSDTLKLNEDFYVIGNGAARTVVKLKNGFDLNLQFDANNLANSIQFSGLGAGINNYMAGKMKLEQDLALNNTKSFFELDKTMFAEKLATTENAINNLLENAQGLDSLFTANEIEGNSRFMNFLKSNYEAQHAILAPIASGKPSPKFKYPNVEGKLISLDDLKGKYVYIDIWATWCGPCKREIPYLKELEQTLDDSKITIVSLSIDNQENKDKWKTMVADRDLSGIQIMADKEWESDFVKNYGITAIPRFLLIDPMGNIVSNDAPRPSDPALKELLKTLNL